MANLTHGNIARLIRDSLLDFPALAHWSGTTTLMDEDMDFLGYNTNNPYAPFWGFEFRIQNIKYRIIYDLTSFRFSLQQKIGDEVVVVLDEVDSLNTIINYFYN